jgi:hypothetical protein
MQVAALEWQRRLGHLDDVFDQFLLGNGIHEL